MYREEVKVGILKLHPDVKTPEYKHFGDACADIRVDNFSKFIKIIYLFWIIIFYIKLIFIKVDIHITI